MATILILITPRVSGARPAEVRMRIRADHRLAAISPYVYGTNDSESDPSDRYGLLRAGGNRWSAFNWENNASNAGADFGHQNDDYLGGGDTPGECLRTRIESAEKSHAALLVTIPLLGRVAKDKGADGDVAITPHFLVARFLRSEPNKNAALSDPPNTSDDIVFQDEMVQWIEKRFPVGGRAARIFYALDNEPALWPTTHPRLHPRATLYAEVRELAVSYARAVKRVAPHALVFGPVSYGWQEMVDLQGASDARLGPEATPAEPFGFLAYYLAAMRSAEGRHGRRLLDVLDVHWYPEPRTGDLRVISDASTVELSALRLQAPRSLWDPQYVEPSWIAEHGTGGAAIRLIPRLRELIQRHYPGTLLSISEYTFGGGGHISGAIAQADALGIFGREGVFAAAEWSHGASDRRFIRGAFRMYRNYDGHGSAFADTAVAASTSDSARTAVYASTDSEGRLTAVLINRSSMPIDIELSIDGSAALRPAGAFELTSNSPHPRPREPIASLGHETFRARLAGNSVTTIALHLAEAR